MTVQPGLSVEDRLSYSCRDVGRLFAKKKVIGNGRRWQAAAAPPPPLPRACKRALYEGERARGFVGAWVRGFLSAGSSCPLGSFLRS